MLRRSCLNLILIFINTSRACPKVIHITYAFGLFVGNRKYSILHVKEKAYGSIKNDFQNRIYETITNLLDFRSSLYWLWAN